MVFLTYKERELLKAQHRQERDRQICDRIKAVLLRDKGWPYDQIADALLLSCDTVRNHIEDFDSREKLRLYPVSTRISNSERCINKAVFRAVSVLLSHRRGGCQLRNLGES